MKQFLVAAMLLAACGKGRDGGGGGTSIDARLHLKMFAKHAKAYYVEKSELPKGKVGPTPAKPCCPDACKPNPTDWEDPTWKTLGVEISEPTHVQYSYEGDGQSYTITATEGCSGTPTTSSISGKITGGTITETMAM